MVRICAVEGCGSGRNADILQRKKLSVRPVTLFAVPKRNNALQTWSNAIGKSLSAKDHVCEFHFPSDSIVREDRTVLCDGTVHRIPRQRYGLVRDAVPIAIAEQENVQPNSKLFNFQKEPTCAFDAPVVGDEMELVPEAPIVKIAPEPVHIQEVNVDGFFDPLLDTSSESSNDVQVDRNIATADVQQNEDEPIQLLANNMINHFTQTPLPETWCWVTNRTDKKSIVFIKTNEYTYKLALRLTVYNDLTVTAHTPDGKVDIELESMVTSTESLHQLLVEMGKKIVCCGTGIDLESRDGSCPGFVPLKECNKQVINQRCGFCRKLRLKILHRINSRKTTLKTRYARTKNRCNVKQRACKRLRQKNEYSYGKHTSTLLIDEMSLSEAISLDRKTLKFQGFVDLGEHTPDSLQNARADHALVFLFQPFRGQWIQVLGCFLSSQVLHKLILECLMKLERSGFHTDVVTTDGAQWNRGVWKLLGIHEGKFSCKHPCDDNRRLRMMSDFPHLIKCFRNGIMALHVESFTTPHGTVKTFLHEVAPSIGD